jgi:hypothetical protein
MLCTNNFLRNLNLSMSLLLIFFSKYYREMRAVEIGNVSVPVTKANSRYCGRPHSFIITIRIVWNVQYIEKYVKYWIVLGKYYLIWFSLTNEILIFLYAQIYCFCAKWGVTLPIFKLFTCYRDAVYQTHCPYNSVKDFVLLV